MENIIIRNVTEEDIPAVVDIKINGWKEAYRDIIDNDFLNGLDKKERIEKWKQNYNQGGFIVAVIESEIVGFCRYVYDNTFSPEMLDIDCELLAIYVKPELKNKGIGRQMFEYIVKEFKEKKKTKMILWCLKDNEASKEFYKKMGGKIIQEKLNKIGDKEYEEVGFIYGI